MSVRVTLLLSLFFLCPENSPGQSDWAEVGMLGILQESLPYIDVGGDQNFDQRGVQVYFTQKFDKAAFDQVFRETAEYGWDTVIYHYLSVLWFLTRPDLENAREECYRAGLAHNATTPASRNVLGRSGLPFRRINHLREFIDFGEHQTSSSLGWDAGQEVKGYTGFFGEDTVPAFPWPPPKASTDCVLPQKMLDGATTLGAAGAKLKNGLSACGYAEKSYFTTPGGFALVTRMEQFNDDGTCKPGGDRWNLSLKPSSFNLADYFRALFWGREGRYRLIVFIVSDEAFSESSEGISQAEGTELLRTGSKYLPASVAKKNFGPDHRCTALVYEFELKESLTEARFLLPGSKTGQLHLQKSGIWENIE